MYRSDFGARWYDASIGRFTSVDPLASDYSFQSPYAYATNNPVLLRDIMGMGVEDFIDIEKSTGEITVTKAEGKDKVRLVNDGKVEDSYVYGKNGSFLSENTIIKGDFGGENGTSIVSAKTEKLDAFYKFAAKSNVEFYKFEGNIDGGNVSVLYTSNGNSRVSGKGVGELAFVFSSIGFDISVASHSHPRDNIVPSGHYGYMKGSPQSYGVIPPGAEGAGYDAKHARELKTFSAFKNAKFQVYNAKHKKIATYDGIYPAKFRNAD